MPDAITPQVDGWLFVICVGLAGALIGGLLLAPWASRNRIGGTDEEDDTSGTGLRVVASPHSMPTWYRPVATLAGLLAFGALAWAYGPSWLLPGLLAFAAAGIAMSLVDLEEQRLPNRMLLPSMAAVATLLVLAATVNGTWWSLLGALAGGAAMFALYFLVAIVAPGGMGFGDVKLAAMIGLVLGCLGWVFWAAGLVIAFFIGGVIAVVAILLRMVTLRGHVPFGPSMVAGAVIAASLPLLAEI
ncbi:prepilin peptidase [Agromyces sp. SYSU T00194]|uniref:prepilin peptidase n=1 Tax=Agromyces chitinivorans TaxID=3158560 RepID=UPI00339B74E5